MPRQIRFSLVESSLGFIFCALLMTDAQCQTLLTRVGDPVWTETNTHLFSAPAATDSEFYAVLDVVRPFLLDGGAEWDDVLDSHGYRETNTFLIDEVEGDIGVYMAWGGLPNSDAPLGSSEDFDHGPIIPADVLPIRHTAQYKKDGVVLDLATTESRLSYAKDGMGRPEPVVCRVLYFYA